MRFTEQNKKKTDPRYFLNEQMELLQRNYDDQNENEYFRQAEKVLGTELKPTEVAKIKRAYGRGFPFAHAVKLVQNSRNFDKLSPEQKQAQLAQTTKEMERGFGRAGKNLSTKKQAAKKAVPKQATTASKPAAPAAKPAAVAKPAAPAAKPAAVATSPNQQKPKTTTPQAAPPTSGIENLGIPDYMLKKDEAEAAAERKMRQELGARAREEQLLRIKREEEKERQRIIDREKRLQQARERVKRGGETEIVKESIEREKSFNRIKNKKSIKLFRTLIKD